MVGIRGAALDYSKGGNSCVTFSMLQVTKKKEV
jgi:hypothetical protein